MILKERPKTNKVERFQVSQQITKVFTTISYASYFLPLLTLALGILDGEGEFASPFESFDKDVSECGGRSERTSLFRERSESFVILEESECDL